MCRQTRTNNPCRMDVRTPLCRLLDSGMLGDCRTSGFNGIQKASRWVSRSLLELATQGTLRVRLLQSEMWRENFTIRIGRQTFPFRLAMPAFLIAGAAGCVDATPLVLRHTEPIWSKVLTVAVIWILVPCLTVALAASGRRIRGMKQQFVATRRVIDEQYATLKETSEELLLERNAREDKVRLRTAELEASLDRLTESDRIKTNFLASITHELRTPLTMISVPVKSIRDKRYGTSIPADHPIFELVERNVDRLNHQITQLLDFARLDQGAMPFNPQLIPLVAYARGLVAEMVDLARLRGLVLVMANCTTMHEIYIHADRYMLDTALINLLNNALKFTEQGVVRLILEPEPNQVAVRVTVEDTGIGFDPAVKDSLFNRFVQGDARHDHTPEGIGLGLALVREIAVCHGWYLDADGQPGGGARFSLSMPVSPEPGCSECNSVDHVSSRIRRTAAVLPPPTMMDLPLGMTKKNVILVVDDNPDMGTLVRDVLEPDFSVAWCRRGEDAILYLSDNPLVSLIVCDVMMPGMSGFALREKLAERRDFRDIPFVFLTALNTEVDRFRGLSVGALDYVLKPFNASDLLLKIRNILDLQDARYRQALADSMAVERLSHIGLAVSTGTLDTTRIIRNASITPAEERVMELIRKGLQDKEIAERLSISPRTVASHLHRLYRKTGTGNRLELMGWMVDSGIGKS
jgi:signal transduction histidine kinase/DNA-binding NarL/FixJ family response regulator